MLSQHFCAFWTVVDLSNEEITFCTRVGYDTLLRIYNSDLHSTGYTRASARNSSIGATVAGLDNKDRLSTVVADQLN